MMKHGTKFSVAHINALLAEADESGKYLYLHRQDFKTPWRVIRVTTTQGEVVAITTAGFTEVNPITDTFDIR
jgi:hypothetical protein